jgi:hypothetical protein
MVGDQTADQVAKSLKKGEKITTSGTVVLHSLLFFYSFSIQSCLFVSPCSGGWNMSLVVWLSVKL